MGKRGSQVRVGNIYRQSNSYFIFIFFRITYEALDILEVEEEVIEDVEEEGVVVWEVAGTLEAEEAGEVGWEVRGEHTEAGEEARPQTE